MAAGDYCPFCRRIAAGEVLLEGVEAATIPDANPEHPGHVLVVPRRCEPDLFALPAAVLEEIWLMVERVQADLRSRYPEDGVRVRVNIGAAAGQSVNHAHVHVLGRPDRGQRRR